MQAFVKTYAHIHTFICCVYVSFGEVSVQMFDFLIVLFDFLMNFQSSLHILDTSPVLDIIF